MFCTGVLLSGSAFKLWTGTANSFKRLNNIVGKIMVFFKFFFSSSRGAGAYYFLHRIVQKLERYIWMESFSAMLLFIERVGEVCGSYQNLLQSCFCGLCVSKWEREMEGVKKGCLRMFQKC